MQISLTIKSNSDSAVQDKQTQNKEKHAATSTTVIEKKSDKRIDRWGQQHAQKGTSEFTPGVTGNEQIPLVTGKP